MEIRISKKPLFKRQQYEFIAEVIHRELLFQGDRERIVRIFSKYFEEDNEYFQPEKFRRMACGFDNNPSSINFHRKGGKKSEESFE